MKSFRSVFSHARQETGATAIEFAIVAPVMFLMLFGIVEYALIMYASSVIENAATAASRYGITGDSYTEAGDFQKNTGGLSRGGLQGFIAKQVYDLSSGLLDPAHVKISNRIYNNFGGVSYADPPSDNNADPGGSSRTVLYYVTYEWPMLTPMAGEIFGDENGNFNISSAVLVKNERF
jgi:Flp pilus assembly protein TadG